MNCGGPGALDGGSGQTSLLNRIFSSLPVAANICGRAFFATTLAACASNQLALLPEAPGARAGDATLTVIVTASGQDQLPRGSLIVVTLADTSKGVVDPLPIAGDAVRISQADQSVRISLPADRAQLDKCRGPNMCGLYVRVVENGRVVLGNESPVPYRAGQKVFKVAVAG